MRWDLLLEWMTHLGSGAWASFREAVAELATEDDELDEDARSRMLRITLSDLGHADFFVGGSRRWEVLRPALVGLSGRSEHLFVGGRTRSLFERLRQAAASSRVTLTVDDVIPGLRLVHLAGEPEAIRDVAEVTGVPYVPHAAARLSTLLTSARSSIERAQAREEPINWTVRSWSFQDQIWVPGKLEHTVREYSNRHGARRYLVHVDRAGLREVEKRTSFYCAALARGARIVRYSPENGSLHVPVWAPLPGAYARTACLASGRLGSVRDRHIVFENIDAGIASTLLVALGQGFPTTELFDE
jgi:hypothetical protein